MWGKKILILAAVILTLTLFANAGLDSIETPEPKPRLEQKISILQTTSPTTGAAEMFLADCNEILDPNWYPNLNSDQLVNFEDFAIFGTNWRQSGSGLAGDFDDNGTVNLNDMVVLAYYWLANACGPSPEEVFYAFKSALLADDTDKALTFIAEASRDRYAEIFQIIEPNLPDYAAGLGDLILERQSEGKIIYEMPYQDGPQTLLFPVIFIRDNDSSWRIFNF